MHYAAEMTKAHQAAQGLQKETLPREIHTAEAATANALNAGRHTTMATARNADTPTSIRDGWERIFNTTIN